MDIDKLDIQLNFLRDDLNKFDSNPHYAVRIATIIRILIHDTQSSTSLLSHLGLKNDILFIDSAEELGMMPIDNFSEKKIGTEISVEKYLETNSYRGLTAEFSEDSGVRLIPFYKHLEIGGFNTNEHILNAFNWLTFEEWWKAVVYRNSSGVEADRSFITLKAANKDGGAHYDSSLPHKYLLVMEDEIDWPDGYLPENIINSPLYPSIAQIGWELLKSIELRNDH